MNFDYSKFRVKEGTKVSLNNCATSEDGGFTKKTAKEEIKENIKELKKLQEMFYADNRYSLLIILQARVAVGDIILELFRSLDLHYPPAESPEILAKAKDQLTNE